MTVRALLALQPQRRRLLLVTLAVTVLARVGLSVTSFRATARVLGRVPTSASTRTPVDIRWAVTAVGARVPGATCLERGLTAHTLCRRYGHASELHVGVDRTDGRLLAHSWVELDERVVVGDEVDLDRFEPLGAVESA